MNNQRNFDLLQIQKLGKYVYALRDPRDKKIFYIGQGTGNRVFAHFNEADSVNVNHIDLSKVNSKTLRILDIWRNSEEVEWIILASGLPVDSGLADYIEAAVYDSLSESQNGDTLNEVSPPKSSRLSPEDIVALGAEYINPEFAVNNVFVFPIQNAINTGVTVYNATRAAWSVTGSYRQQLPAYAVGLRNSISIGSFEIEERRFASVDRNKHEFLSPNHPNPFPHNPLLNKSWTKVLEKAKGYWQRGNYLLVDFDGSGQFRIKRGSADTTTWHTCV